MRVLVRATANVIGLTRGQVAYVEVGQLVDGLIEGGFLQWLDAPAPTFKDYEVTAVVKQRAERATETPAGPEAVVGFIPAHETTVAEWEYEGGYSGSDES